MNDVACPWCETALELPVETAGEQQCPECLTSWRYEEDEVPLAAAA